MKVAKVVMGLLSMALGILLLTFITLYYAGSFDEPSRIEPSPASNLVLVSSIWAIPLLFLAVYMTRQRLAPWLWPMIIVLFASFAVTLGSSSVILAGIDLKSLTAGDAIGLKRMAVSILNSETLFLVSYFAMAAAWFGLSAALKPVVDLSPSIRSFRTWCALIGLSIVSVVGFPLAFVFITLAYIALGAFLIATKLGMRDAHRLRYIDDYRPA